MLKINGFVFLSGVLGCGLILVPQIASAETPNLIAQQVFNGLPAAPPLPPGFSSPVAPELQLQPPAAPAPLPDSVPALTSPSTQRYLVLVNGDSPLLLTQVRQVEAGAFIQEHAGKRVIQVGLYGNAVNAQQQVEALAAEGIRAKVLNVSGEAATNPQLNAGGTAASTVAAPTVAAADGAGINEADATPYFVVIPGNLDILPEIANQVIRLSEGYAIAAKVEEAERPLGNHVRVGPFSGRRAASRWSRYFRNFGMDARVDYRR
jgi:hypothetical protein